MNRRAITLSAASLLTAVGARMGRAAAPDTTQGHKLVIHVGGGDPALMATALHNAANAIDGYSERHQAIQIEIVVNGPGYAMVREGVSPVADLVAETLRQHPGLVIAACQISRRGIAHAEGKTPADIKELPGITDIPSGIVRLTDLQEQGYSYVRV